MQLGAELPAVQKRLKVSLAERAVVELNDVKRVESAGAERTGQLGTQRMVRLPREEEFNADIQCSLGIPSVGRLLLDLRSRKSQTHRVREATKQTS